MIHTRFQRLCTSGSGGISFALTPAPRHPSTGLRPAERFVILSRRKTACRPGMVLVPKHDSSHHSTTLTYDGKQAGSVAVDRPEGA